MSIITNWETQSRRISDIKDVAPCLDTGGEGGMHSMATIFDGAIVRRLTPMECERLQGMPDNHTLIEWKGKQDPDSLRYKAIGNSMAVPVMRWIGERLEMVDSKLDTKRDKS